MSLYQDWIDLYESQTKETFQEFWNKYSTSEKKIYQTILAAKDSAFSGIISEKADEIGVDRVIFMGFLDGISDSLNTPIDVKEMEEDTAFALDINWEKLYFNMLDAKADYLYTLEEWNDILTEEERAKITKDFRRSKTVVKEVRIGRNDPCPCGSGKKYKKCCGANL